MKAETVKRLPYAAVKNIVRGGIPQKKATLSDIYVAAYSRAVVLVGLALVTTIIAESINDQGLSVNNNPKSTFVGKVEAPEQVVAVPEDDLKATYLYKGDVGILISDNFKPSKSIKGYLKDMRKPDNLVSWAKIEQINGISVKGASLIRLSDPLTIFADGDENTEFEKWIRSYRQRFDLIKFLARVRQLDGSLVDEYLYLPSTTGESVDFVAGYKHQDQLPAVRIINGRYYYLASPFERKKEIPTREVGRVNVLVRSR